MGVRVGEMVTWNLDLPGEMSIRQSEPGEREAGCRHVWRVVGSHGLDWAPAESMQSEI